MATNYWQGLIGRQVSRRRALAVMSGTTAAAALLAACGGGSSSSGPAASGGGKSSLITDSVDTSRQAKTTGTNKYYIASDPASFDVHIAIAPLEAAQGHVYSRLLQLKAGVLKAQDYSVGPDLAESWEWSPDALQLTMKLRQGVKWHNKAPVNGRPFDVQDVLFSWDRFTKVASNRGQVANVVDPAAPVLGVTATDDKTVVFKLKYPLVYLTSYLANYLSGNVIMIPKETDSTFQIKGDMIGTGPFTLADYKQAQGFVFKRNPDYYVKGTPYLETSEMPIIVEYAQALAQLKAGNIYTYPVRGEDVINVKNETPDLNMYVGAAASTASGNDMAFQTSKTIFGWLPAGKSPFNDERVRQALSIAYDRDLFLDTFYNVSKFRSEGLPVDTRWNSAMSAQFEGWWLDPQSKDFGANAKYYQHDIAEAKKLLAAAGYPNGLEYTSHYTPNGYGADHVRVVDILEGMAQEAGFRVKEKLSHDYVSDFQPKYRDSKGEFEGISYKASAGGVQEPIATLAAEYYSKTGVQWFGFDSGGKGDHSGDPALDAMFEKAFGEVDESKRKALGNDIQRYLAQKQYGVKWLGGATGFSLAWPALGNFNVFKGDQRQADYNWWIDDTKAPLKKA